MHFGREECKSRVGGEKRHLGFCSFSPLRGMDNCANRDQLLRDITPL